MAGTLYPYTVMGEHRVTRKRFFVLVAIAATHVGGGLPASGYVAHDASAAAAEQLGCEVGALDVAAVLNGHVEDGRRADSTMTRVKQVTRTCFNRALAREEPWALEELR